MGMETDRPEWGTPEYDMLRLRHVVDSLPTSKASGAYLSATVTFHGNGDTINEADMLQQAADYFRQHPEMSIAAANWTSTSENDHGTVLRLDLTVIPPETLPPR